MQFQEQDSSDILQQGHSLCQTVFVMAVASIQSCAPTNWWSAVALGGLMTGGGGAPRIFHRWRQRGFMVGSGGVRPDERALKQRTRWTGVFFWFYSGQPLHL